MSDTVEVIILATDKASKPINGIGNELNGLGKILGTVGAVAGAAMAAVGAAIAAGFAMAVKSSIEVNAQLETTTLQFETLMDDAQLAEEHVASLFKFAEKTPFETGPIIDASLKLQTFGGEALNTKENLTLLGDAAAATNAPIDELGFWVGRLYSNLQGGQPFGEAAMRLQELAVMSPKARQAMEALQKSGASASDIFAVLQKDLERFGGAMERQAGTWEGMVSTIKDQLSLLVADAMKPFFENAKNGLGELIKLLNDPDIVAGIKAMGAELGKVADTFFQLTGSVVRFFSALGQEAANQRVFDDLNLSLQETRDLTYEIQQQLGVGFFMTTEEELAVQVAVNEELARRYAAELLLIDGLYARSEAEDWVNEVTRQLNEETETAATNIQNVTGEVMAWRAETMLMGERVKELSTSTKELGDGVPALTSMLSENAAALAATELAAANLSAAFGNLVNDYMVELPAASEPLIAMLDNVGRSQSNLSVNVDATRMAIFDQLVEMGAAPETIAAYGLAIGAMSEQQAIAALAAAAVQLKIEELAATIASGVPVETALADLDKFIDKMELELIPAAEAAAGEVPAHFADMIGPINGTAIEIGDALISGVVEGITTKTPDAIGAAETSAEDVINATKRRYGIESPSKVFEAIGVNIVEGLISGIRSMGEALAGALQAIVDAAILRIKQALGITSPSLLFEEIGVNIAQGLIEGIRSKQGEVFQTIEELVGTAGDLLGLASGFGGLFEQANIAPLEGGIAAIGDQIDAYTQSLQGMADTLGLTLNDPGIFLSLQQILNNPAATLAEKDTATTMLAFLNERQQLTLEQIELERQLEEQQMALLRLEMQRQQLGFLQEQFNLLKLINENGLDPSILQGLTFGLDADPGAILEAMLGAMQSLVTVTAGELAAITPRTADRSIAGEFFGGVNRGGGGMTVNIDARGAMNGADREIRRVVEDVMREYGVRADIRMRT